MPLFTVSCHDRPDSFDLRAATREAHLAYLADCGETVKLGGPWTDDQGRSIGSLLIVEAPDLAAAQAFAAADPYVKAALFEQVVVTPWKLVIGAFTP